MAEQPFERGRMFWRSDEEVIYVLLSDGAYVERGDAWVGPAEYACVADAPSGLLQPKRGFGLVWCSAGGLRDDVGWALEEEKLYSDIIQNSNTV